MSEPTGVQRNSSCSSVSSRASSARRSTGLPATDSSVSSRASSASLSIRLPTTRRLHVFDRSFQQHLIDHGIFPNNHVPPDRHKPSKPNNWHHILRRLAQPRPSYSPVEFTEEEFEKFIQADTFATRENEVLKTEIIPFIENEDAPYETCLCGYNFFDNLDHLTDGTLTGASPDFYCGARPWRLDFRIFSELSKQIVPSWRCPLPIVPNFLVVARDSSDLASEAKVEALYSGILAARGVFSLQNYGKDEREFDNNAYIIASAYCDGFLKMFTIHPSKGTTSGQTEYYMNQLNGWVMTANPNAFREAITWFRNARDWAKEQRDEIIRQANLQLDISPTSNSSCSSDDTDKSEESDDSTSSDSYVRSQDEDSDS